MLRFARRVCVQPLLGPFWRGLRRERQRLQRLQDELLHREFLSRGECHRQHWYGFPRWPEQRSTKRMWCDSSYEFHCNSKHAAKPYQGPSPVSYLFEHKEGGRSNALLFTEMLSTMFFKLVMFFLSWYDLSAKQISSSKFFIRCILALNFSLKGDLITKSIFFLQLFIFSSAAAFSVIRIKTTKLCWLKNRP